METYIEQLAGVGDSAAIDCIRKLYESELISITDILSTTDRYELHSKILAYLKTVKNCTEITNRAIEIAKSNKNSELIFELSKFLGLFELLDRIRLLMEKKDE